jgi:hypothetical protein
MEILKLVREFTCESIKPTIEEVDGKKSWVIEGIGIQMAVKNGNERIYVREPMIEQLQSYCEEYLIKNRAVGELNHPQTPEEQIKVNLERIACKFTDLQINGNDVYLKAKPTAGTPCGDIVINLLNNEVQLGFSSRALAKLVKKPGYTETHCRKIITLSDVVYDPSAPDAFIQGVLEEKDWVYENGLIVEAKGFDKIVDSAKNQFSNMNNKTKNDVVKKVFREYFNTLFKKSK